MNVTLDHIVHFIKAEPAAAAAKWREQGYKAISGGAMKIGEHITASCTLGIHTLSFYRLKRIILPQ